MGRDWGTARHKVEREGKCRLCKKHMAPHNLEAAHVVPRSLGGEDNVDSTIPLCRRCHQLVDSHKVDWLHVLNRGEQAEAVRLIGIERARRRFLPSEYRHNPVVDQRERKARAHADDTR